jgi:Fe-S cluster biogenesis protein NfuA
VLTDPQVIAARIEALLDDLGAVADPRVYELAVEVLRCTSDLYGAGMARVIELAGEEPGALVERLAADPLIGSLLVVHDLHPQGLATRVEQALASVRPFLGQHAGDVELLDVDERVGAVLLRLTGSCDGCPSSAVTLKLAIERAILAVAPEISRIDVDEPEPEIAAVPITLGPRPSYDACPSEVHPVSAP